MYMYDTDNADDSSYYIYAHHLSCYENQEKKGKMWVSRRTNIDRRKTSSNRRRTNNSRRTSNNRKTNSRRRTNNNRRTSNKETRTQVGIWLRLERDDSQIF